MNIRASQCARASIVLAVRDGEATLTRALESVLGQAFDRVQLVAVVMPSRDRSLAICEREAERNIRLDVIETDACDVFAAFDEGIAAARGDYVLLMRQDDWLAPRALELMLSAIDEDGSDLVLPTRAFESFGPRGERLSRTRRVPEVSARSAEAFHAAAAPLIECGALDDVTGRLLNRSRIAELGLRLAFKKDETEFMASYLEGAGRITALPGALYHAGWARIAGSLADQDIFARCELDRRVLQDMAARWGMADDDELASAIERVHLHRVIACIHEVCERKSISSIERTARVRDMVEAASTREAVRSVVAHPETKRDFGIMLAPIEHRNVLACCLSACFSHLVGMAPALPPRNDTAVA